MFSTGKKNWKCIPVYSIVRLSGKINLYWQQWQLFEKRTSLCADFKNLCKTLREVVFTECPYWVVLIDKSVYIWLAGSKSIQFFSWFEVLSYLTWNWSQVYFLVASKTKAANTIKVVISLWNRRSGPWGAGQQF